jgi:hypothetical protein
MTEYVLVPVVITSMLLSMVSVLITFGYELQYVLPLAHVSVTVGVALLVYAIFLHIITFL